MSEDIKLVELILQVQIEGVDSDRIDRTTRQLRSELLGVDGVESVEMFSEGSVPEGAMAVDAMNLGALVLAILPVAISSLIEYLIAWQLRTPTPIKIEIQLGDKRIAVEIPETTSNEKLEEMVSSIMKKMEENNG